MAEQLELTERQINLIHKIPLFRGLTDDMKAKLLDKLDYSVSRILKGEVIIKQDTICSHMLILLEGKLEVNIIDITGNYIKVENIVAPRAFATPHLFNDNNIFPATFSVVEDGILLKATKESVFKLISSVPDLLKNFLKVTGNCNACTVSRLRILSYKSIRSRFVYYLFEHKIEDSVSEMNHNQTQLAVYIGVSRPALANEIAKMEKEGLITVDGAIVKLLSLTKLSQYI
ncbi:Crp/Fnr family transcriptional regulator [Dysgonomonas sp. Marseille-P4677]|uniref:Crp/Fnr family transcriptional regulator n=1 Tax=Dysgonomonas sp. Marseille-P4677 TaxID=2364790 RepID=UPI001913BB24|nr:Crp/Fnr family transcriptional regulator [Dysgonomonas sp. Marseille-P4677]MBK5720374.1 Crp/Fnr family transcriptional regulator [Dysgonomonas sp. Marseille-P4677]